MKTLDEAIAAGLAERKAEEERRCQEKIIEEKRQREVFERDVEYFRVKLEEGDHLLNLVKEAVKCGKTDIVVFQCAAYAAAVRTFPGFYACHREEQDPNSESPSCTMGVVTITWRSGVG